MNNTIENIKNHRSIRQYLDKDISDEIIDEIIKAAQAMPNSINGQQTTVIAIRDKSKKEKLAELVGNQEYVAKAPVFLVFVMDFYRTYLAGEKTGSKQIIHEDIESALVGAVDSGITLGAAIIAAESLGLGTVPIGGIRKNPEEVIELLDLPKYTFPLVGLAIGYPSDESHTKPRIPFESFRHNDTYNKEAIENSIDSYDEEMEAYLKDIGRYDKEKNWSTLTSSVYQNIYYPKVKDAMKKQGFTPAK
ncbi:NADPH-dependent oxidoreductase [Clostridium beijerinckii]|jgi:FMN reductase [NAD(P)H]|uniref:NADPH-dependent oxidoreductase n=2 Tax=Clostridium beijerinckii TaxID=1520 RepID=A0AB74V9P5_CLOBE|nr:NADPH-dependent oxidoreductase [Clostridium beijerinckii]MBC2456867.1 NADPH-dependent oxidoreductase [Clostridium beijerinckii]MBC2473393.1 NADPH-dependent oxidoreductase [Clostridium beijerinckii]MCI1580723.1 NADPH-dependent oxidoreductase [Clostridium beijerinckii]MCI1583443.1 NADPH-dependent oxidoreductase [Clostridium beijerinckii]MCI1623649.1 NADPH-dependent oxidoreductase [Clostridium beijerinckii]